MNSLWKTEFINFHNATPRHSCLAPALVFFSKLTLALSTILGVCFRFHSTSALADVIVRSYFTSSCCNASVKGFIRSLHPLQRRKRAAKKSSGHAADEFVFLSSFNEEWMQRCTSGDQTNPQSRWSEGVRSFDGLQRHRVHPALIGLQLAAVTDCKAEN
jgi:hypothetical protein